MADRTLIHIPIIHTEMEMGSLAPGLAQAHRERKGEAKYEQHKLTVEQIWDTLHDRILALPLDFTQAHLYQDSLPVCGKEPEIVRDLAGQGSRNHQLLRSLVGRGATLHGTEDAQFLIQEYEIQKQLLQNPSAPPPAADLLAVREHRDRFIARHIDKTLPTAATGLLFIGLLHEVPCHLPNSIAIDYQFHELFFGKPTA
ncbi:MAG: hypothetical protein H8E20_14145 [Verrucomicrobia bacterium]|nr:hypothetical protein [Verrucomicrobiota bacterium]